MQIRTFRADSLQDALEEIRQQMGPDASVLHTRQVRDGWMGWLGRTYVEVTAGIRDQDNAADHQAHPTLVVADTHHGDAHRKADVRRVRQHSTGPARPDLAILPASQSTGDPTAPIAQRAHTKRLLLPRQLEMYRDALLTAAVPPTTVDRWINATNSFAASLGDTVAQPWLEHLQRSVARELRLGGPIRIPPGARHVVALVGPTGVGKTTTVAKLAAGFRIESKRRVGLLTIDTFRIAAVQQLKAYAEIMDLPMQVVEQPNQMRPALDLLGDVDLVLIDTAGRSPKSDARIDQLTELLLSAQPDETHLVLSATSSASAINAVLKGFAPARPTAAILTKLDEAPQTAGILSAVTASDQFAGVPVSYLTNGQQVPDDISVADAESLLSRLLPPSAALPRMDAA